MCCFCYLLREGRGRESGNEWEGLGGEVGLRETGRWRGGGVTRAERAIEEVLTTIVSTEDSFRWIRIGLFMQWCYYARPLVLVTHLNILPHPLQRIGQPS